MPTYKKKAKFDDTPAGIKARQALLDMVSDSEFRTDDYFSANAVLHPGNLMSFVDKHMEYLGAHPSTDPDYYIANLRLMTRIK